MGLASEKFFAFAGFEKTFNHLFSLYVGIPRPPCRKDNIRFSNGISDIVVIAVADMFIRAGEVVCPDEGKLVHNYQPVDIVKWLKTFGKYQFFQKLNGFVGNLGVCNTWILENGANGLSALSATGLQ